MIKAVLRQVRDKNGKLIPGIFENLQGGLEPIYSKNIERGEIQYWHQSGYGYLTAKSVKIVR
jgi:hypothetical protein